MKASILAIGTELTRGQIFNKNAATVSEKLLHYGVETYIHITVPDDRKVILENLILLESQSDMIFITGGLGPTSDDFTREVVADWLQKPLVFDEKSWAHIVQRLSSRGFPVRDMQKQQCYFPEGSEVLENKEGTAHAFKFKKNAKTIFVLPGPPREIESVWQDHIAAWLKVETKDIAKRITRSWDTIGVGESDVAYTVENVLAAFQKSNQLEVGYRVHLPYVEVKLSLNEKDTAIFHETLLQLNEKLTPITIARNFEDIAERLTTKIALADFTFYDFLTKGFLHARLSPYLKNVKQWSFKQSAPTDLTVDFFDNEENFLALLPYEEFSCIVAYGVGPVRGQMILEAPMRSAPMLERRLQYFSEMALVEVTRAFS